MRLTRRAPLVLALSLLTSARASGRNWAKDSYECERDARLSVGSGGRETFREVRSLAEQCMVARGYSKVPAQP